jgi:hypothetical protein
VVQLWSWDTRRRPIASWPSHNMQASVMVNRFSLYSSQSLSGTRTRDPLRARLSLGGGEPPGELCWLAEVAKQGKAILRDLKT